MLNQVGLRHPQYGKHASYTMSLESGHDVLAACHGRHGGQRLRCPCHVAAILCSLILKLSATIQLWPGRLS